jgi:hypothetical protein
MGMVHLGHACTGGEPWAGLGYHGTEVGEERRCHSPQINKAKWVAEIASGSGLEEIWATRNKREQMMKGAGASLAAGNMGAGVGGFASKIALRGMKGLVKKTEFDGETEKELKLRSVRSGWVVHVAKNMNQMNTAKVIAAGHDGLHIMEGNVKNERAPVEELAWLDLTCISRPDGPAMVKIVEGQKVRGVVPQIIRLMGAHDLLDNPDEDYDDFEFAVDKEELKWEWVAVLKVCGAVLSESTETNYERYKRRNKKTKDREKEYYRKLDNLLLKMEEDAAKQDVEDEEMAKTRYKEMEEQTVRDYNAKKLKLGHKCPCGSGQPYEKCHYIEYPTLTRRIQVRAQPANSTHPIYLSHPSHRGRSKRRRPARKQREKRQRTRSSSRGWCCCTPMRRWV